MGFADSAAQSDPLRLLERSLEQGRLGHAYLFTGGVAAELEHAARALAQVLNCQSPRRRASNGQSLESCNACVACRKIAVDFHPDVTWVRPESKSRVVTVDQMRDLLRIAHLKPGEASFKVAVIVDADRLNIQAANAFLKTLEEPPPRCVIILLSTAPQRLLETILSRCLRVNFGGGELAPCAPEARRWIQTLADTATGEHGGLLARYQMLGLVLAELARVKSAVEAGLTERSPLQQHPDVEASLREKWETELAAGIEAEYRRRRAELLLGLQWWLRDIWLGSIRLAEAPVFPEAAAATRALASRLSPEQALENLVMIERTQALLQTNVQEALALEVGLLRLRL